MDPSDSACVENLRPRTVPEGLLALGTVVQVSEIQVKLQITGGIICLVDRLNISQTYSNLIEEYSSSCGSSQAPAKLSQMFKKGQQYVCKIIECRPRKGYADAVDIIATLDPFEIQEDNLPKTILSIPQVPLQCSVKSVEDHGYQMDVGFKGMAGFLAFEDSESYCNKHNEGLKLRPGQVVRCCSKVSLSDDVSSRVVQLSLSKDDLKKSKFSTEKAQHYKLTDRCILPGSKSFLTVMKVARDGLIVNFMNEFAGFVSMNHLVDPWHNTKQDYKVSQQYTCVVLYFNPITRMFALSLRKATNFKKALSAIIDNYHLGKIIKKAEVAFLCGTKSIYFKIDNSIKAVANVKDALDKDIGTMTKDEILNELDATFSDSSKHICRIKSINYSDLILVVSLRQDFMNLDYISAEELKSADFIEVIVKKHVKDGVVVTFGLNLRAIILNSHLSGSSSARANKLYPIGKKIKCRVLKVDLNKQPPRVYLTNKEEFMDPNLTIVDSYDRTLQAKMTNGVVNKIRQDGVIVEFFNNVKGFIPRRFLSTAKIDKIEDILEVGQAVSCVIYRVDQSMQSLALGMIPYSEIMKEKKQKKLVSKANRELMMQKRIDENLRKKSKKNLKRDKSSQRASKENKMQDEIESEEVATDVDDDEDHDELCKGPGDDERTNKLKEAAIKSRRQRSEEARLREEKLRETEKQLTDPDRPPQSIMDFERLVLKTPNDASAWIKYSKFFLNNVETEKARIVCRRALRTINFRLENEKLKVWLQLIRIEASYGGNEQLKQVISEASQTSDKIKLYSSACPVLCSCGEFDEAEKLHELLLKLKRQSAEIWVDYLRFLMESRRNFDKARKAFVEACKYVPKQDLVNLKSRFSQFEFKFGEVERGKTMFENLLGDNPKRTDLWRVYEGMIKKFGDRDLDSDEVREQNEATLKRISESIELVSKKAKRVKLDN